MQISSIYPREIRRRAQRRKIRKYSGRMICNLGLRFFALALAGFFMMPPAATGGSFMSQESVASGSHSAEHETAAAKTIVDLQAFRQTSSIRIKSSGNHEGVATLINLNPIINVWYLLKVTWQGGSESSYHLENPQPRFRRFTLDSNYPLGINVWEGNATYRCNLFEDSSLDRARNSQIAYAPLCDTRVLLRNRVTGHRTNLEAASEFLRDNLWGGETIIAVFHHLLKDNNRETSQIDDQEKPGSSTGAGRSNPELPLSALIDPKYANRSVTPSQSGPALENPEPAGLRPGAWYSAMGNPGIYISYIEPRMIDAAILESQKTRVNVLDSVEASSLCYLIAFDVDDFELAYARGTQHPAVGWSDHIQSGIKDSRLPGPEGIGSVSPLVSTGLISPEYTQRTVAAFTAGFKRSHAAFKYGELASKNNGSHYGFVENGVVFSKLQPGLATVFVLDNDSINLKTWTFQDDRILTKVKYARQNGVPLVEFDEGSQSVVPGPLVNRWGPGNWSGSEDTKLRTIRSAMALQANARKRFLIYAVFTDATPSAMARVFQAYQCRFGMLLDMNALEHTYLALYRRAGQQLVVDYLIRGMSVVDKTNSGGAVPRFLGYPDNRDFFYVLRRNP